MKWIAIAGLLVISGASAATNSTRDDAAARAAFQSGYTVLMHPRCMNCHPSRRSHRSRAMTVTSTFRT